MIEGRSLKLLHGLTSSKLLSLERANALLFTRLIATFAFSAEILSSKNSQITCKEIFRSCLNKNKETV